MSEARRELKGVKKGSSSGDQESSWRAKRPRMGAHMSIAGGHYRAAEAATAVGCEALQVFTKSSNQWAAKALTEEDVRAFRRALEEGKIEAVVGHNSYLINLGSPEDGLWGKSIEAMVVELERAERLGISDLVFHPGSHMGAGEEAGIERVIAGVKEVLRRTGGFQTRLAIESTAGQGNSLGYCFEHLGAIVERVEAEDRMGVCLDTCHLFAAGYDFVTQATYDRMIDGLDRAVGVGRVRVWHVNDSLKPLGSRVDRHAGIGRGEIGLQPFGFLVRDARFREIPMILETPKGIEAGQELDVINLAVLRGLLKAQDIPRVAGRGKRQRSVESLEGDGQRSG